MAAETLTREEQIERYVVLDALDGLLNAIACSLPDGLIPARVFDDPTVEIAGLTALRDELWPDGVFLNETDDAAVPEYDHLSVRASLLQAKMLLALAMDHAWLTQRASDALDLPAGVLRRIKSVGGE